jgi:S1-C subfamily serine protease
MGPLGRAGFEVNDILLAIDGQIITGVDAFAEMMKRLPPHQKIALIVLDYRTGQTGSLQVISR